MGVLGDSSDRGLDLWFLANETDFCNLAMINRNTPERPSVRDVLPHVYTLNKYIGYVIMF